MITVVVFVGSTPVYARSAIKVRGGIEPDDIGVYAVDDGRTVTHRYGDGAPKLAQKLLKGVIPVGTGETARALAEAIKESHRGKDS